MENSSLKADSVASTLVAYSKLSIPQLQKLLTLDYKAARTLAGELVRCNWLLPPEKEDPLSFTVVKKRLKKRTLSEKTLVAIAQKLCRDDAAALRLLARQFGASFAMLQEAVQGQSDTEEAVERLCDFGLIYQHGNMYYSAVNAETLRSLEEEFQRANSTSKSGRAQGPFARHFTNLADGSDD